MVYAVIARADITTDSNVIIKELLPPRGPRPGAGGAGGAGGRTSRLRPSLAGRYRRQLGGLSILILTVE